MSSSINTFLQFYSIWKLREVEKKKTGGWIDWATTVTFYQNKQNGT